MPRRKHLGQFWGSFRGLKLGKFGVNVGLVFVTRIWTLFKLLRGLFWGPILGPDRPKSDQDGSKRAFKSFKVLKTCICKILKTHSFKVFGVQGHLRQPRKAQEGSQEAPEGFQNLEKTCKNRHTFCHNLNKFWDHFGVRSGVEIGSKRRPKM